jgi:membrane protein DedA with SNARE-associated domain
MELLNKIEVFILGAAQTIYDAWGWPGVAALLAFENATSITPSELILGLAGWMLLAEHQLSPAMIFIGGFYAAIGSVIGASIIYWVARLGGRPMVDKVARLAHIDATHITRVETQFQRWGTALVLFGRVIPGVRTLISIPAGLARMPYSTFLAATFIGAYAWCSLIISAGYLKGHEWELIRAYVKQALPYLVGGGMIALTLYFWIARRSTERAYVPVRSNDE